MEIYANASSAATREALRRLGESLHPMVKHEPEAHNERRGCCCTFVLYSVPTGWLDGLQKWR
jgi:hypothetical protein